MSIMIIVLKWATTIFLSPFFNCRDFFHCLHYKGNEIFVPFGLVFVGKAVCLGYCFNMSTETHKVLDPFLAHRRACSSVEPEASGSKTIGTIDIVINALSVETLASCQQIRWYSIAHAQRPHGRFIRHDVHDSRVVKVLSNGWSITRHDIHDRSTMIVLCDSTILAGLLYNLIRPAGDRTLI